MEEELLQLLPGFFKTAFVLSFFPTLLFLGILGYLRSVITGKKPDFLINQKNLQEDWFRRSSATSFFMPLMAFFIFLFNGFAWSVYGLISIIEFIVFILRAIWWLIAWIWNEVIHPVLFFVVKLLWHYLIIWSWRFFKLAITRIPEAFKAETYKNGFVSVLILSFVLLTLFYISRIFMQDWILVVMIFVALIGVIYFSGFTLYNDSKRSIDEFWTELMTTKGIVLVLFSLVSAGLIILLHLTAGTVVQVPVLGLSFPLTQLLIIVFAVTFLATLFANTIFPAYMSENQGDFETKNFLLSTLVRLPRVIASIPFLLFGGLIVSIPTLLLGAFLLWSTQSIKNSFCENAESKVSNELRMERNNLAGFSDTVSVISLANDYASRNIPNIARLQGKMYELGLLKNSWSWILINIPEGIRNTKAFEKELFYLEEDHIKARERIVREITLAEERLSEARASLVVNQEDATILMRIENEREFYNRQVINLNKLEAKHILSRSMKEQEISSVASVNFRWVVGTFLAMLGFVLLSAIVFTPWWIYRTKFFFDLYSYHHSGKSYYTEQIEFYQSRNANQPLIGFFVISLPVILYLIFRMLLPSVMKFF
jgi:hypothetical protein